MMMSSQDRLFRPHKNAACSVWQVARPGLWCTLQLQSPVIPCQHVMTHSRTEQCWFTMSHMQHCLQWYLWKPNLFFQVVQYEPLLVLLALHSHGVSQQIHLVHHNLCTSLALVLSPFQPSWSTLVDISQATMYLSGARFSCIVIQSSCQTVMDIFQAACVRGLQVI